MDRRRAAGALLALAACIACSTAAPTASNQTALELLEGPSEGCYYNFQHYGEDDRIMTNEPCLNCTCHNKMLMCYLKVCPFTKPIGQDCTIEKRADQCCPIVTCPDVPVDLLTSTSTTSPAEYGATGLGKVDKYGCSINGKYFPEGSKVPPTPNKPCEHCYCIRNMTTCVMQECTLHVDGCTPIYNKDVCCPVRYSCDHLEDEMLLLDDMTTTIRPTPGFLLTTTNMPSVTQPSQNCVHDDQIFADGALIKTEIACEHCYCMKGDIVCVVQECGTPMENEGKNCSSLPPRQGQCCPDTYICEGDDLLTEVTTVTYDELTTLSPPRRVEGSGYRNEPDEPYTEIPSFEGSGEEHATTLDLSEMMTSQKQTPEIIDEIFAATEESFTPIRTTSEPDKGQNTVPDEANENTPDSQISGTTMIAHDATSTIQPTVSEIIKETDTIESKTTISDYHPSSSEADSYPSKDDEFIMTTESNKITEIKSEIELETTDSLNVIDEVTTQQTYTKPSSSEDRTEYKHEDETTTLSPDTSKLDEMSQSIITTTNIPTDDSENDLDEKDKQDLSVTDTVNEDTGSLETTTASRIELPETTLINLVENEIGEDLLPPGRIPGEGDCLLNGVTYRNNSNVPNINNCHSSCKCISSIVKCDPIICSPPPEQMDNMNDCQPIYDTPDACCPTYVCHSRETIPPESHSQMSGTESPKPSNEKPGSECQDEQCQPYLTPSNVPELCAAGNCKPEVVNQEKECQNGNCDHTEFIINTSPSEACEGNDCNVGSEVKVPLCKDSEECKSSDTSSCDGPTCSKSDEDKPIPDKNIVPSECSGENCRRKEHPQDERKPSECSGSSCSTKEVEIESGILTTESAIQDQIYKDTTTEITGDSSSKLPASPETPTVETPKVTMHLETTTENQDTSPDRSTDKSEDVTIHDLNESVTDKEESYTEPHVSKMEESTTKIHDKTEMEDYQTLTPDTYTTKSKEPITESIEYATKETFTKPPFTEQYDGHPTYLPKEDISETPERVTEESPTKSFVTSTEVLDTVVHDHEYNKGDAPATDIVEEFTQKQEITTIPTHIPTTTPKLLETDVTKQEYDKEHEIYTESPEQYSTLLEEVVPQVTEKQEPTKIINEDSEYTGTPTNIPKTESVTVLPELSDEKDIDVNIKEGEVSYTKVDNEDNVSGQFTTEQFVYPEQSSEQHESKLGETATDKLNDEIEKSSTETPNIAAGITDKQITVSELNKIEEPESQTTIMETLPMEVDIDKTPYDSSIKDQEDLRQPSDTQDTVTGKQDTYTTPSLTQVTHATQPSLMEEHLDTETHATPVSQQIDREEFTTPESEIPVTNLHEITTETIHLHTISLETMPDILEEHTLKETLQDDTTHKDSAVTDGELNEIMATHIDDLEITPKPIQDKPSPGSETTMSAISSDISQEISTKYPESELGMDISGESTEIPEVHSTKSDEATSMQPETQKKTSISDQLEGEAITTESSKQPFEDKTERPDSIQLGVQTQPSSLDVSTLAPTISYTEGHDATGDKTISVSIDEHQTNEKPSYTTPGTITQFTEKQDTIADEHVTKGIEINISDTHSIEEEQKPIDHTTSNELEPQVYERTTETQDVETKLTTELQADLEVYTSPAHGIKDEQETESPMSLITEVLESYSEKDTQDVVKDTATTSPHVNVSDLENIQTPEHHYTNPALAYTESPQLPNQTEAKEPSISDKESQPESAFTSTSPGYTTVKILDVHDKENPPSITENAYYITEVAEKLSPVTEYQDVTTFTPISTKIESELYPVDVAYESSSVAADITGPEEQDMVTSYPDVPGSETTYDHESDIKLQNEPEKEHTLEDASDKPKDYTTPDSETSEPLKDDHGVSQPEQNIITDQKVEPTISPEVLVTKYPDTLDNTQDKQTNEHHTTEKEQYTLSPKQPITEEIAYTEQTVLSDNEVLSSADQDQEKSTEKPIIPSYEDSTTLKAESITDLSESYTSASGVLPTESSEISPSEVTHEHTLPDQYTTENLIITEFSEVTKTPETKITETMQEISTKAPEQESVTKSIPQATENEVEPTETGLPYDDQELPVVTENIDKLNTETDVDEDLHTELPVASVTEQDETIEKTTVSGDLIKIPVDTIPVEVPSDTVEHKSYTEPSIPKATELYEPIHTEAPVPNETESEISVSVETEISIPKVTESSILKETETIVPKATDTSTTSKGTDFTVPSITETSRSDVTESSISKETESSLVPEVSVTSSHEESETSANDVTETSAAEETKPTASEAVDTSVPEITEASVSEVTVALDDVVTQAILPDITEPSVAKITDTSGPEVTKASVSDVTVAFVDEASSAETTETSPAELTESSVPKITESRITYKEPEITTYKPKDEKSEVPTEQSPTLEPIHSSSETTPYLVELQEHTTKVDEDISLVTVYVEDKTNAPETYQTERGDQPLEVLPEKSTQEDSHEEYTTKETFTKKDEQLPTLPPKQVSEYPEVVTDRIEAATEEIEISSKSPISTISHTQLGQHTVSSSEQSITMSPAVSETFSEQEKFTTAVFEVETTTDNKNLQISTEKIPEHEIMHVTTSSDDALIPTITKATTIKTPEEVSTHLPEVDDKFIKPEEKPIESYTPTTAPELPKPGVNEIHPTEEIPSPDFSPSGPSGYGQEPDYVEEDQAFGPGTCRYGGKVYVSAQQIPRDDPCDFCFCFRSDIICLQQSCPPPIHGCHEEPIQGFCCPRYECPVSMATTLNVTTTTTTTTTTLPPHFLPHAYKGAAQRRGCQIKGHSYKVGEVVRASSGPCLHCTCGGDGQMKCDPKACTPEPMLRQMIAAAVSAKRRR